MLRSILDLADVELEDIMIHRQNVFMLDADSPRDALIEAILDSPHTRSRFTVKSTG